MFQDQLRRYVEIKHTDMPSAMAAKKTKEFRCPPREQVRSELCLEWRIVICATYTIEIMKKNILLLVKL